MTQTLKIDFVSDISGMVQIPRVLVNTGRAEASQNILRYVG